MSSVMPFAAPPVAFERLHGNASLFAALGFPRLAPVLNDLAAPWIAVGAWSGETPVGLALGQMQGERGCLLSLSVTPAMRRRGIGCGLVRAWEEAARAEGASSLTTGYSNRLPARAALAATLASAGWSAPRLEQISVIGETGPMVEAVAQWSSVARSLRDPGSFTFEPWRTPDAADIAALAALAAEPDYIPQMHPDEGSAPIEEACSIAVRRDDQLLGWVIGERTDRIPLDGYRDRPAIHYRSAYLARSLWHTGLLVTAYWHAYARQAEAFGPDSIAFFFTCVPRMMALTQRRFAPIALRVDESFFSFKGVLPDSGRN
ncbi:GNAT family N-acetyltransferase [Telmatospirillum sp. J64-1]|uniref:GNAT family N-acetyltransferase n=1 Tax=Telmatospirillum sp. J64-1 TaxID=2502183 RepID=UPI00115E60D1|nr:GNAT family N-acetyltransferase [Telmatospirillum sp. J64-1]